MPGIGIQFLPGAQGENGPTSPRGGGDPIQEAVRILSLRLPRVVGAQAIAPQALLTSPGGAANPFIDTLVDMILRRVMPNGNMGGGQGSMSGGQGRVPPPMNQAVQRLSTMAGPRPQPTSMQGPQAYGAQGLHAYGAGTTPSPRVGFQLPPDGSQPGPGAPPESTIPPPEIFPGPMPIPEYEDEVIRRVTNPHPPQDFPGPRPDGEDWLSPFGRRFTA